MFRVKNKGIIWTIAGMAILALVLVWLVFFRQAGSIKKLSEDYQKEKLNSFVLQEKSNKLSQLRKEVQNLDDQNKKFQAMFLKQDEALPFLRELEKAAEDSGCSVQVSPLDLKKIRFEKDRQKAKPEEGDDDARGEKTGSGAQKIQPEKKDDLAEFKNYPAFTIEATGAFTSVANFLAKVESLPYFVRVITLDAAPAAAKDKAAASGAVSAGQAVPVSAEQGSAAGEEKVRLTFTAVIYAR